MSEEASWFARLAKKTSCHAGRPGTFAIAVLFIVIWAATGPLFHFSDTWQLVVNTSTTIVTFLMVFLIQNSQNRDSLALQLKLDELLRAQALASNAMLDAEEKSDEELDRIQAKFVRIAKESRKERDSSGKHHPQD